MIPVMQPWIGEEEAAAAAAAIASGWVAQGPRVTEFEEAFAAATETGHAIAVSSCTAALHLALVVSEIGPGDEVVVPSLSFIATANAVCYVGATPVFADVDPLTQNITPETIEPHLTGRTRAVIAVDQAGVPADLNGIRAVCDRRGIEVIEDAACAVGSTYCRQPTGALARLAAFSFHPRKLLTTGEGGMLVTPERHLADRLRRLREHGMDISASRRHASKRPVFERYLEVGFNYRMTDIQAAIGLVQLGRIGSLVTRRRELAERYRSLLSAIPGLRMIGDPAYGTTNYQSFWVLLPDGFPTSRDQLMSELFEAGISARRGIMAAHLEPAYADQPHASLPVTEEFTERSLILPLFHELTEAQQDYVVSAMVTAAGGSPSSTQFAARVL
jgi:perosamine synthetase